MEESGRLIRWRWAAPAATGSERVGTAPVVAAAFSGHDSRTLALADGRGMAEWISGRRFSVPGRIADIYAVAVSSDGSRFAAAHGDGITVLAARSGAPDDARRHRHASAASPSAETARRSPPATRRAR